MIINDKGTLLPEPPAVKTENYFRKLQRLKEGEMRDVLTDENKITLEKNWLQPAEIYWTDHTKV